jgi:tetratricopeptide (TPR) repeat protein
LIFLSETGRRMSNLPPQKTSRNPERLRGAATSSGAAAVPDTHNAERQLAAFEAASRLFHARKFREARDLFVAASEGPERDVSHRAQLHAMMCARRLEQAEIRCETAEECYNYGIALLNTRNMEQARIYLERALDLAPDSGHIHYAMALVEALSNDVAEASEHLKRAIDLDPKSRLMARQDADFGAVSGHPQFQALLYPEKKSW